MGFILSTDDSQHYRTECYRIETGGRKMAEKYAYMRNVQCGEREIPLTCPLCEGKYFYYRDVYADILVGFKDVDKHLICRDCGKVQIFSDDSIIIDILTPVEKWEQRFIFEGENKERRLLKILSDEKNYDEDARTAARNLLGKLNRKR